MPQPLKDEAVRQRTNKATTRAELDPNGKARMPSFPAGLFGEEGDPLRPRQPHTLTRRWWRVIWKSPMAPRWLEADVERLFLVAALRDRFFREPSTTLASEIRQQEQTLGLTPLDRRRLEWHIAGPSSAPSAIAPREVEEAEGEDPRNLLRMVK